MAVRGVAVLGLAAIVGCYDPSVPVGLPCGAGCPSGQECQDGLCFPPGARADGAIQIDAMAPIDSAAPVDSDGDGVLDELDNCPEDANPDQHDEDADNRGDTCDLCPHVAEQQVQDADGDEVGDLCDPVTGTQHTIVFFDPFTADLPEWTLLGPWVRANDMLSIDATTDHATVTVPIGESVFELGGRITALGALNHQITMTVSNAGTLSYYCEIYDNGTPRFNLTENDNGVYSPVDFTLLPNPLPPAAFRFAARASVSDATGGCDLQYGAADYELAGTADLSATSRTAINVSNVNLELDYAIQINAVP